MKNFVVEELKQVPTYKQKIEIVERKGLGHPDTICDLIMNEISIKLSEEYLKKFGTILHYNIDKALLSAGEAEFKFGGGKIKKPMLLIIGDRATYSINGEEIPVKEIAISTAKKWFKENSRFVDPENHVKYQVELKQVGEELADIFKRKKEVLGAGDTSAAVGYAPLTPTENLVLETEKFLNSKEFKKEFKETGEDIKVMGSRIGNELNLTIAVPFIDRFIDSEDTYFKRKEEVNQKLLEFLEEKYSMNFSNFDVHLNTLDVKGRGTAGIYLSVIGTSAETTDSGQVGRGNRPNGVISLNRYASEEAAAGKNPVSHVGKIYNLLSFKIAKKIYNNISGIEEVYVWLLSQIGRPINDPKLAAAQVVLKEGTPLNTVKNGIGEILYKELENINEFCKELIKGKISIC